jgi:hypothetical protein
LLKLPLRFHDVQLPLAIFTEYRFSAMARILDLAFRAIQDSSPLCCCTRRLRIAG